MSEARTMQRLRARAINAAHHLGADSCRHIIALFGSAYLPPDARSKQLVRIARRFLRNAA